MSGETNLEKLLAGMSPRLVDGEYVFRSLENGRYGDHAELCPLASFVEDEGLTLVIPRAQADQHDLSYESVFKCITLSVHSSLDAVGLTAAVSTRLAQQGISANVIAAFHHDHIFVQTENAERAMVALEPGDHQP